MESELFSEEADNPETEEATEEATEEVTGVVMEEVTEEVMEEVMDAATDAATEEVVVNKDLFHVFCSCLLRKSSGGIVKME